MTPTLPASFVLRGVPSVRGYDLVLSATDELAREYWARGEVSLPPQATLALADVGRVFPGAKVIKIRLPQLGLREFE